MKRVILILQTILVVIIMLAAQPSRASQATDYNVEKLGEWVEGENWAIAADGDLVYLGNGPQFQVIDFGNGSQPVVLASIVVTEPGKYVYDIDLLDGLAYVTTKDNLHVIDVTDPANPYVVLHQNIPFTFLVDASDDYIYASGLSGVRILERSGGDEFTQLSFYPDFGTPYPVTFASSSDAVGRGDYLYYGHTGLTVLDISNPYAPQVVGHDSEEPWGNTKIALQGDRVYMVSGYLLRIYDVSDPSNPSQIDSLWASDYLYFNDVLPVGNFVYCAAERGLLVVDVSGAGAPAIVWNRDIGSTCLAIRDDNVFVSYNSWVQSLDVSNPAVPVEGAKLPTGSRYKDMKVDNGTAYVADSQYGLRIFDVSDPARPWPVGSHYVDDTVTHLEVVKNDVYLFSYYSMSVIDVSDPSNPVEITRRLAPHYYASTAVAGEYLFVSNQHVGFDVLDVSDPSNPVVAAEYGVDLGLDPRLAIEGNLLYIVGSKFYPEVHPKLRIVDVSDPANPADVGSFSLFDLVAFAKGVEYLPYEIDVSNGYVFLPCGNGGVRIIDASDPTAPREIRGIETSGKIVVASASNNLLYAAEIHAPGWLSGPTTIRVLNVSDPANPVEVGRYVEAPAKSYPIFITDQKRLFCALQSKFSVLEFRRGRAADEPKIELSSTPDSPAAGPALGGAFPNPFNPSTAIRYTLPARTRVSLAIYDVQGRLMTKLKDGWENAGEYNAEWNGRDANGAAAPSGVYFVRLEAGGDVQTRKITLLK